MTPKKRTPPAFQSFRILGSKAQALFHRARSTPPPSPSRSTKKTSKDPHAIIRVPASNVLHGTLTVLAVAVGAWLLWVLIDKIILLLLALFVSSTIDPGVRMLERWGCARGVAVLLQYAVALVLITFLVFSLTPIIAQQITDIARFVSTHIDGFLAHPSIALPLLPTELNDRLTLLLQATLENLSVSRFTDALEQWGQNLSGIAQGSFVLATRVAGSVVSFFVQLVVILVLAFFIQMEKEQIRHWIRGFLRPQSRNYLDQKLEAIQVKISQWARGQVVLALVIAALVFVALTILGMPYALTLAVLAGFTEFIPYVGPFIAAVPAVLIAVTQGGFLWALIVAGVYYVIQWCENNLLVPLIMKRAVGLSPIAVIFSMLVGISFPAIIHPILGILIAIPATTIIAIFLDDVREEE